MLTIQNANWYGFWDNPKFPYDTERKHLKALFPYHIEMGDFDKHLKIMHEKLMFRI
jgi:hypothetical protein